MILRTLFLCVALAACVFAKASVSAPPSSDLSGSVIDGETKKPLNNVSITLILQSSKEKKSATSDSNGNYSFDGIKSGIYRVIYQRDGYKKVTRDNVSLREDDGTAINIELFESDPPHWIPGVILED